MVQDKGTATHEDSVAVIATGTHPTRTTMVEKETDTT